MTISSEVQARVSTALLVQLTRPDDKTATTVDTTLLGLAIDDVTGDFASFGITIDDSNKAHVAVAVDGVILRLMTYKGMESESQRARYMAGLERLEAVGPRSHLVPITDSELEPSDERPAGYTGELRPTFDPENLAGWQPRSPRGGNRGPWPHYGQ